MRRPASLNAAAILFRAAAIFSAMCPYLAAAPWVIITELHFYPPDGEGAEFIEVHNREAPRADLGDWTLEGEVDFRFPPGTTLLPGQYLIVVRDPAAWRARPGAPRRLAGPFTGRLDNRGGRVTLRNAAGAEVSEVRYEAGGLWPLSPDGTGHTLSLLDPALDPGEPRSWAPSERLGGTPGLPNFVPPRAPATRLIPRGDPWRYWRGANPPPEAWQAVNLDDKSWESGAPGFGYGDGDDATTISGMRGNYLSLFVRKDFSVADPAKMGRLILRADYDDGFIAYLNGREVARANMGSEGSAVAHDQPARGRHEAGLPSELDLGEASRLLQPGRNVLAAQVHNSDLGSSDLSLNLELESREPPAKVTRVVLPVLNEAFLAPGAADGFVEVFNPSPADCELGGYFLSDDPATLRKFQIPAPRSIPPRGFAVFKAAELGPGFGAGAASLLTLTRPDGQQVIDALRLKDGKPRSEADAEPGAGEGQGGKAEGAKTAGTQEKSKAARPKEAKSKDGASKGSASKDGGSKTRAAKPETSPEEPPGPRGRFPDGSPAIRRLAAPTPGSANRAELVEDLVINEIMYHPAGDNSDDEYLEIYNRGTAPRPLQGFRLAGAVRYRFAAGDSLPAGGYLVVAKNPAALAKKYGLARDKIAGPYKGALRDAGDLVLLLDPQGNPADEVMYGDSPPWPRWADGRGSSLELTDPRLDNSLPGAWAASDDRSKAKWETFRYVKEHRLFEGHNEPNLQFLLLTEGECLIDDVHLRSEREHFIDGSFERGGPGWQGLGTHERSGLWKEEAAQGKLSYRMVSDGRGNIRDNCVAVAVGDGLSPGTRYQVSFRAKWQRGSPLLLTRTIGQGLSKAHVLPIPSRLGSPGAENTSHGRSSAPVVGVPVQAPVAPASDQPVAFQVRLSAVEEIAEALLFYRHDKSPEWLQAPLERPAGAGDSAGGGGSASGGGSAVPWTGEVPGLPPGLIEFYIRARDRKGGEGTFPADAPARTALYAVGLLPSPRLPTYTLLVSDAEWKKLGSRPRLSNLLADGTLVYGTSRIFYNVGFRPRGSPFTRSSRNWRIVMGADRLDGRRALTVDGQNGDGTNPRERLTYWLIDQLRTSSSRQQYVFFRLWGKQEGIYEDVEKIDGSYLDRWFGKPEPEELADREAGKKKAKAAGEPLGTILHKIDDYFELFGDGSRAYREADLVWKSNDPEDYRWNFTPRGNDTEEDFGPLLRLAQLFDARATPDRAFDERLSREVDVDQWLRVLAARTIVDDWDTFGRTRGKNAFFYLSAVDQRWRLLPWDCDLSFGNPAAPIFSPKFPAVRRILDRPVYRRLYLCYLGYLAQRKLDPEVFGATLADLRARCGVETGGFAAFAQARRAHVLGELPQDPFRVAESRRVDRSKEPDLCRLSGTAPVPALRFRLGGREGPARFLDASRFTVEIPVGPEGGDLVFEALDFGGNEVARTRVRVVERRAALPLPAEPKPAELVVLGPEEVASAEPDAPPSGGTPVPPPEGTNPEGPPPEGTSPERPPTEAPPSGSELAGAPAAPEAGGSGKAAPGATGLTGSRAPEDGDLWSAAEKAAGKSAKPPPPIESSAAQASSEDDPSSPDEPASDGQHEAVATAGSSAKPKAREIPAPTVPPGSAAQGSAAPGGEATAAPKSPPAASGSSFRRLAVAILVFVALFSLALVYVFWKLRRAAGADQHLQALGDPQFEPAQAALESLSRGPVDDVPLLLDALADRRLTPFGQLKRSSEGLSALPTREPGKIRVCQVAALLLERHIGKPSAHPPTREHWLRQWEAHQKSQLP